MDLAYRSEKGDSEEKKEAESSHIILARSSGHVGPASFT